MLFQTATVCTATVNLLRAGQERAGIQMEPRLPCADTRQDGEIQAGVVWPEPRVKENGDEMVTDTLTGLM